MTDVKNWLLALALCAAGFVAEADAHGRRRDDCAPPPIKVVLEVCHPKTGCKHDVPVCIPACCLNVPPCVKFERTLLGHGRTVFSWPCGHEVTVRYKCCGGIRVRQDD